MKNQAYRMAMLFDFYGDVLTDRQKEIAAERLTAQTKDAK